MTFIGNSRHLYRIILANNDAEKNQFTAINNNLKDAVCIYFEIYKHSVVILKQLVFYSIFSYQIYTMLLHWFYVSIDEYHVYPL